MGAAVEDVEHGDWQAHFAPSRKIAPERYAFASVLDGGAGFGHSHGNGENGVDAQVAFVGGAVKFDEPEVYALLVRWGTAH